MDDAKGVGKDVKDGAEAVGEDAKAVAETADDFQQSHRPLAFLTAVWKKFGEDQASALAALIAFYAFFAVFPLLLLLVTILGIALKNDVSLQHRILNSALANFPIIGDQLKKNIGSLNSAGPSLVVGILGLIWGARGLALSIGNALDTIWGVPYRERPRMLKSFGRALLILVVVGVGVVVTGFLSGFTSSAGGHSLILRVLAFVGAVIVSAAGFVVGFKVSTAARVPLRGFVPGAIVAGVASQILLVAGSYLVSHSLQHAQQVYGLFALVIGLLTWLQLQATACLYAAEVDVVRERNLWPRRVGKDAALTDGDRNAYTDYVRAQMRIPQQRAHVDFDGAQDCETSSASR